MKTKIYILLIGIVMLGASLLPAQQLTDYASIKLLESSLEERIRNGISATMPAIPFYVSVNVYSTRVNMPKKERVSSQWGDDKVKPTRLPGLFLDDILLSKKEKKGDYHLNDDTSNIFLDHIEVIIELDKSVSKVHEKEIERIAVEKADLVSNRGDRVIIKHSEVFSHDDFKDQLDAIAQARQKVADEKSEMKNITREFMDAQTRLLRQYAEGQEKYQRNISNRQEDMLLSIKYLSEDMARKIEATKANLELEHKETKSYWAMAFLILLLISVVLYFFSRSSQKSMNNDIATRITMLQEEINRKDTSVLPVDMKTSSNGELSHHKQGQNLARLMLGQKNTVKKYIRDAIDTKEGREKVAVFANQLGKKQLQKMFTNKEDDILNRINEATETVEIDDETMPQKLNELCLEIEELTDSVADIQESVNPYSFLNKIDTDQIHLLIQDENIGIKALVLSQLDKEKASRILADLNVNDRLKITMEMATLKPMGEAEYNALSERLVEKIIRLPKINHFVIDGTSTIVDAINMMIPGEQHMTLSKIKSQDPELFLKITETNLFFDDLQNIPVDIFKEAVAETDPATLALVLRDSDENFRDLMATTIGERRFALIQEAINTMVDKIPTQEEFNQSRYNFVKITNRIAHRRKYLPRTQR
ncbi:MAG: FliG C-terminal domain-containing protein [bacterium]